MEEINKDERMQHLKRREHEHQVEIKRLNFRIFNQREEITKLLEKCDRLKAEIDEYKHKEQCWKELNEYAQNTNNYWCIQEKKICAYCNSLGMCEHVGVCPYHCVDIAYTTSARTVNYCTEKNIICEYADSYGGCSVTGCVKNYI